MLPSEKPPEQSPPPDEKTGVDSSGRKVWDKAFYAAKAQEKIAVADDVDEALVTLAAIPKEKKLPPPPSERKPLQKRDFQVVLDSNLGQKKVVTPYTPKAQQGGYWCDVCDCLLKDSQTYLDHINGKKHNRLLGMTMRVERTSASAVRQRIESIKQKRRREQDEAAAPAPAKDEIPTEPRARRRRKRAASAEEVTPHEDEEEEEEDEEMVAVRKMLAM